MTCLSKPGSDPLALLTRILEEPEAVGMVQAMDARALASLIQHIGLEDAGDHPRVFFSL